MFCTLCRNSRGPPKIVAKMILGKKWQMTAYILWFKNFVEIARSHNIYEINAFLRFRHEENFWKNVSDDRLLPVHQKFRRNRSISHCFQDKDVFAFYAQIHDGCQKWRKLIFGKNWLMSLCIPCSSKIFLR